MKDNDINDLSELAEKETKLTAALQQKVKDFNPSEEQSNEVPPKIIPLPNELPPVEPFSEDLLPEVLRPWIVDISDRMQCPPDYAAVAAIVAAGSILGNKVEIEPKLHDDWTERANIWGMIVGRPGSMKSPVLEAVLKALQHISKNANEGHKRKLLKYEAEVSAAKLWQKAREQAARKRIDNGEKIDPEELIVSEEIEKPGMRRPLINDATVEALHEILRQNHNGSLLYQDEIAGLLARLRDPERGGELRAFLLSAWSGNSSYTSDRITRGLNLHVPRCCLSVLGGTQPGKISPLVSSAIKEDASDDGFLQRFSLIVWPDLDKQWKFVDREPNEVAFEAALNAYVRLEGIPGGDEEPYRYSFAQDAAEVFARKFLTPLEHRLRSSDEHPAVLTHLSKFRKLIPGLALIFELLDNENPHDVSLVSLERAMAWLPYLESHARRLYGASDRNEVRAAKLILKKIHGGMVPRLEDKPELLGEAPFASWQVWRPNWSGLTDKKAVEAAIQLLVAHGWLIERTEHTGGRPGKLYYPNPTAKN